MSERQTVDWIRTYRRHSRVYAWGFFLLVLPLILGVIWWEMGEINADVLSSFGFAAAVFFLLAKWSRWSATLSWVGEVEGMELKEMHLRRSDGQHDEISLRYIVTVRTDRGKLRKLRLSRTLYDYFEIGDQIFKVSGFNYPEKVILNRTSRVCIACGDIFDLDAGQCSCCRAPVPDHSTLVHMSDLESQ